MGGDSAWGVSVQGGVPCDLSHHAFDVTCMLSCHQLRLITSAAAYIVFGHVTCGACWDTSPPPPPPPVDRMTDTCKNITFVSSGGKKSLSDIHGKPYVLADPSRSNIFYSCSCRGKSGQIIVFHANH